MKIYSEVLDRHYDAHLCYFTLKEGEKTGMLAHAFTLDVTEGTGFLNKGLRLYRRVRNLRRIKKHLGITHTISFMDGANLVNILSRTKGEKVIVSIRSSVKSELLPTRLADFVTKKMVVPYFYRLADTIVPVSNDLGKELRQEFKLPEKKIRPITNFYDIEHYRKLGQENVDPFWQRLFQTYPVLVSVGRLNVQKNFSAQLDIFIELKKTIPRAKLLIIGEGELLDELVAKVSDAGLSCFHYRQPGAPVERDDVFFLGYRSNPHKYAAKATLFVFPSLYEGFPNGMAEAMLVGCAVVAADCPTGPREILNVPDNSYESNCGILLPVPTTPQTVKQWAEAIGGLLRDKSRIEMFRINAKRRMMVYSKEEAMQKWINELS